MTQDRNESTPDGIPMAAGEEVEDHIREAEDLLELLEEEGKDGSKPFEGDIEEVMKKLNTAIAISNDPYARELKKRLMMRFPQSERKDK